MWFNSFEFWVFFPIVFGLYCILAHRAQNRLLLVASYFFYGLYDYRFLSLIIISTLTDYTSALLMTRGRLTTRHRVGCPLLALAAVFIFATVNWQAVRWAGGIHVDWMRWLNLGTWGWYTLAGVAALAVLGNALYTWLTGLPETVRKRICLAISITVNLSILGYFKYCDFFLYNANGILSGLNIETIPLTGILVPAGISFYTFQTMSYSIDVYRGRASATDDLPSYALYVAYFPQLVAGPIERSSRLLPQMMKPRKMTWEGWCEGATLILFGLFKKVAVADMVGQHTLRALQNPEAFSSAGLLFALYCFTLRIYADFSGYSDIARGLARMMGIDLMENFNTPYFSVNITEFWRRWHISLSTWLRDYLYIPLGGNRHGAAATYRNLFVTMFLGGLWHGASWTFVIWGMLHGIYLAVHRWWCGEGRKTDTRDFSGVKGWLSYAMGMLFTFHLVTLTWVFFMADSFATAWSYLRGLFSLRTYGAMKQAYHSGVTTLRPFDFDADDVNMVIFATVVLLAVIDIPQYICRNHTGLLKWRYGWKIAAVTVLVLWLLLTRGTEELPFIYFQF